MPLQLLSIELTNRCSKACYFCYNHSQPGGDTRWAVDEVVAFVSDCALHGLKAVSFGGGEPLQFPGLFDVMRQLSGKLFRSMTTNGLLLEGEFIEQLAHSSPDKVHVSVHFPDRPVEVRRAIDRCNSLSQHRIRCGVNLLVARSQLEAARSAANLLHDAGIGNDRIVYLPMRGRDTPSPKEVAYVAGTDKFQSMSCLTQCGPSPRFVSIGWDKSVAWCSYTSSRHRLRSLTFAGLHDALAGLGLEFCGGNDELTSERSSLPILAGG